MVKQIFQFYHKFNSFVIGLFEIKEKRLFPVLWKSDVFMPDFHISGNTGGRVDLCDNAFSKRTLTTE